VALLMKHTIPVVFLRTSIIKWTCWGSKSGVLFTSEYKIRQSKSKNLIQCHMEVRRELDKNVAWNFVLQTYRFLMSK